MRHRLLEGLPAMVLGDTHDPCTRRLVPEVEALAERVGGTPEVARHLSAHDRHRGGLDRVVGVLEAAARDDRQPHRLEVARADLVQVRPSALRPGVLVQARHARASDRNTRLEGNRVGRGGRLDAWERTHAIASSLVHVGAFRRSVRPVPHHLGEYDPVGIVSEVELRRRSEASNEEPCPG